MERSPSPQTVLITGMSGAGHSTALKVFEDCGYEAIDNLRLSLVPKLLRPGSGVAPPVALGIDSRTKDFSGDSLLANLDLLAAKSEVSLLFIDCSDEVLARRFGETRRPHPLAPDKPAQVGIEQERKLLSQVRRRADCLIDTTATSIYDLRRMLIGYFRLDGFAGLRVFITSFSFRQGVPRSADLVFDVRFLANPYWISELRGLCGLDQEVAEVIVADPDFAAFLGHITGVLGIVIPRLGQDGKSYLTVAVGCTGGRHRSVFMAEQLATKLPEIVGPPEISVSLEHRDLIIPSPRMSSGSIGLKSASVR